MMNLFNRLYLFAFAFFVVAASFTTARGFLTTPQAQWYYYNTVALSGESAPDGNGSSDSFSTPALNNLGQAAFHVRFTNTSNGGRDDRGILLGNGMAGPTQIAREGQAAPDGNGRLAGLEDTVLNDLGQVVVLGALIDTSGGNTDDRGIFLGNGMTGPSQIVREGQPAPDGNGAFSHLASPMINNAGQVAFAGNLIGTLDGGNDNSGVFISDDMNPLRQLARAGQAAPDNNGNFVGFGAPALNDSGKAAFFGSLIGTSGGDDDDDGIFLSDGMKGLLQIARRGQTAPDGNGRFSGFHLPLLNDIGQTAFIGVLRETSDGANDDIGIFLGDGMTDLTQVVREGQAAPDGNGTLSHLNDPAFTSLLLNNAGQIAFRGFLSGTSGGGSDNVGIFSGDGGTDLTQIVRKGQLAPDSNGIFLEFSSEALNNEGQIAFMGTLTQSSSGTSRGIYLYDASLGLIQVVREGDAYLGSTIRRLNFANGNSGERSGLNDRGQIAYQFELTDGRHGIAIASPIPEPKSLVMGALAGMVMLSMRSLSSRRYNPLSRSCLLA